MSDKPNFIVFMSDDHGHRDLSCMGATDFQTPNFDRIAARGAKLTRWYSNAPICSAGRCGILTGRYPIAAGIPGNVGVNADGLSPDLPTIPSALKKLGYQTYMSGKWHLGNREPFLPHNHGFDHWFGFTNGCIDYYSHTCYWPLTSGQQARHDLWEDGREVYRNGEYFVDLMRDKAIEYIEKAKRDGRPFFMYIPFNTPHYPMHAPEEYMERFAHLSRARQLMAAMLAVMDDALGKILDELERLALFDNTCIFFQPDHGPSREPRNWTDGTDLPFPGGDTGGLRGHKGTLWEGGIRVPTLMSWPARVQGGKTIDEIGIGMDIFPTMLAAAGGDPEAHRLDGADILPMIADDAPSPHAAADLFWTRGQRGETRAIQNDRYKLLLDKNEIHLSNLDSDPNETTNIAGDEPELTNALLARLNAWHGAL